MHIQVLFYICMYMFYCESVYLHVWLDWPVELPQTIYQIAGEEERSVEAT